VIPTLARLKAPGSVGIRALLLAPTRELAEQIHREVQRLVEGRRFKVCLLSKKISGKAIASQVRSEVHVYTCACRMLKRLER
jgi:ATP-dependent RNA helicase DDX52/ROK1